MRACLAIAVMVIVYGCDKQQDDVPSSGSEASDSSSSEDSVSDDPDACASQPQPDGAPSGIERCDPSVSWNRTEPVTCAASASVPPEDDGCVDPCTSFVVPGVCRDGTEITGEPFCHYECQTDADCGEGAACICAFEGMHSFTQCVDAGCRSGADCPSGTCGLSRLCDLVSTLQCRSDADACAGDTPCSERLDPAFGSEAHCTYYTRDESFTCDPWVCGE